MNHIERMSAAVQHVQDNDLAAWPFSGPAPDMEIDEVAKKMGCQITGSYREFIRLLGDQTDGGFRGVNMEYLHSGVVGTTKIVREEHNMPNHYLVVWNDESFTDLCIMDCSDPQGNGEFPVYQIILDFWEDSRTKIANSFVEFFEDFFDIKNGKPTKTLPPEKKPARSPALPKRTKQDESDETPSGRMRAAVEKLYEMEPDHVFWGNVPHKEIDRVAKTLGLSITGSYREFIWLVGGEDNLFTGIDKNNKQVGVLAETERARQELGLPEHYLVVFCHVDSLAEFAYLMDCSAPREDGECPIYRIFVDDWQDTLEHMADSFVEQFENTYRGVADN